MAGKEKGYKLIFDETSKVLQIRLWGLWDEEFAENFEGEFKKKVQEAGATGKEWYILADITEFPPQFQQVQQFLAEAMRRAKTYGVKKAARIVDKTITKLQIARLSKEMDFPEHSFFRSEDEARQWLLSE